MQNTRCKPQSTGARMFFIYVIRIFLSINKTHVFQNIHDAEYHSFIASYAIKIFRVLQILNIYRLNLLHFIYLLETYLLIACLLTHFQGKNHKLWYNINSASTANVKLYYSVKVRNSHSNFKVCMYEYFQCYILSFYASLTTFSNLCTLASCKSKEAPTLT